MPVRRYGCIVDIGVGEGVGVGVVCAWAFAMFAPAAATTAMSAKAANKPFMKRIPSSERKRDRGISQYVRSYPRKRAVYTRQPLGRF